MQISAINNASFKGRYDEDYIDVPCRETYPVAKSDYANIDKCQRVAGVMDEHGADRVSSPIKFFVATVALAGAALFATKAVSMKALDKLDANTPVHNMFAAAGRKINQFTDYIVKKFPEPEQAQKTWGEFFGNGMRKMAAAIERYGEKGVAQDVISGLDTAAAKEICGANAAKKAVASALGIGAGASTLAVRYKDDDKNGIPDKAEKTLNGVKETVSILSAFTDIFC